MQLLHRLAFRGTSKMKLQHVALIGALSFAGAAQASTVKLDLGALPLGPFTAPLVVGDYQLTPQLGPSATPSIILFNGKYVLANDDVKGSYAGNDVFLSRVDGGAFTLNSVTIGYEGQSRGAQAVNPSNAPGLDVFPTLTPQTLRFGSMFAGSTSIDLNEQSGPYFTDIIVSSGTPEPSAWALMLVGFGGLGMALRIRRRMTLAAA
jgi:hypothetical protein